MKKKISFICIFIVVIIITLQQAAFAYVPELFRNEESFEITNITYDTNGEIATITAVNKNNGIRYEYNASTNTLIAYAKDSNGGPEIAVQYSFENNKFKLYTSGTLLNLVNGLGNGAYKPGLHSINSDYDGVKTFGQVIGQFGFIQEVGWERHDVQPTTITKIDDVDYQKVDPVSLDEIVSNANSFVNKGQTQISDENMQAISNTIYNVIFVIGIALTLLIGAVLGIKFITSSLEEKADIKQAFVPYVIGVVVLFGAFTIWKIVLVVLQG